MNAIPTKYAGVQFRSRLEARWAAVFDLLGWKWEYEPIDLDGYIPDFILQFEQPLLVEVKPALAEADYHEAQHKIVASGWQGEAWIVGATLTTDCESAYAGYMRHPSFAPGVWWSAQIEWIPDAAVIPTDQALHPAGHWSPHTVEGQWGCRVHRDCTRKIYSSFARWNSPGKRVEILNVWREAGNITQWKPPQRDSRPSLRDTQAETAVLREIVLAAQNGIYRSQSHWARGGAHRDLQMSPTSITDTIRRLCEQENSPLQVEPEHPVSHRRHPIGFIVPVVGCYPPIQRTPCRST